MDRLKAVQIFSRVVERGSLSRAAEDLGIGQSTVSKALAGLEQTVGTQLVLRSTRRVTVTEAGLRFHRETRSMLETWEAATQALTEGDELRGTLKIHGPVVLGELYLGPIAVAFQRQHPAVRCELTFFDGFVDLVAEGADLALRLGAVTDASIIRRRLGSMQRLLVASPDYLARRGRPRSPSDLERHDWVRFTGLAGGDTQRIGRHQVRLTPTFLANNAVTLKHAALGGLGVALVTRWLVHDELRSGALIEVLPRHPLTALEVNAVFPTPRFIPRRVRQFVAALEAGLRDAPGMKTSQR